MFPSRFRCKEKEIDQQRLRLLPLRSMFVCRKCPQRLQHKNANLRNDYKVSRKLFLFSFQTSSEKRHSSVLELLAQKMDGFDPQKIFEKINQLVSQGNSFFSSLPCQPWPTDCDLSGVGVPAASSSSAASGNSSNAAELKSRIESLQKVLFDPTSTPQQIDKANIEYEKE